MTSVTNLKAENVTLTAGVNVLAVARSAASGDPAANLNLKRVEISQSGSTTLGMVRGEISKRNNLGTLTATATTPVQLHPIDGAASGLTGNVAPVGDDGRSGTNGTVDTGGTYVQLLPFAFPNLSGYLWKPAPDEEIWVPPSTVVVVRFVADPASLTGWTISVVMNED